MSYIAHITKVETGVTVSVPFDDDYNYSLWAYGNYSCDCNRELFFLRASGGDPDISDVQCSDGRFTVEIDAPDGHHIIDDIR